MNEETEQMSFCTVTATVQGLQYNTRSICEFTADLGSAELYSTDHHTQQGFMSCHVGHLSDGLRGSVLVLT